jgi:hypothetical protein
MHAPTTIALCLTTMLAGCGGDPDTATAAATFSKFQAALQQGDRGRCRDLLTEDSATAIDALPWDRVQERQALVVLGAERGQGDFRVKVQDPNDGGKCSEFVVVREYGRMVVDLVATAGLSAVVVEGAGAKDVLEPRPLTDADYERIRQRQLAQPPR